MHFCPQPVLGWHTSIVTSELVLAAFPHAAHPRNVMLDLPGSLLKFLASDKAHLLSETA